MRNRSRSSARTASHECLLICASHGIAGTLFPVPAFTGPPPGLKISRVEVRCFRDDLFSFLMLRRRHRSGIAPRPRFYLEVRHLPRIDDSGDVVWFSSIGRGASACHAVTPGCKSPLAKENGISLSANLMPLRLR